MFIRRKIVRSRTLRCPPLLNRHKTLHKLLRIILLVLPRHHRHPRHKTELARLLQPVHKRHHIRPRPLHLRLITTPDERQLVRRHQRIQRPRRNQLQIQPRPQVVLHQIVQISVPRRLVRILLQIVANPRTLLLRRRCLPPPHLKRIHLRLQSRKPSLRPEHQARIPRPPKDIGKEKQSTEQDD